MSLEERCAHQGVDSGPHVLFKEKWERCKNCAYDPENNKKCSDYAKADYYVPDKRSEPIISEQITEKINEVEVIIPEELKFNLSTLPVSQN